MKHPVSTPTPDLFLRDLRVVNAGLESFHAEVRQAGAHSVHLDWRPPAGADPARAARLARLASAFGPKIDEANRLAVRALLSARPFLTGVAPALEVVPGMAPDLVLHAGPPVEWERMCGPMRGGVIGGLLFEGLARDRGEAESLAAAGRVRFAPCHHHAAVGPMAGVVTASMPMMVFENGAAGNRAFCSLNEGLGKVLRYGAFSYEVVERLKWMAETLARVLDRALRLHGPVDARALIAQALQMGDEGHNRNRAGTSLLIRELAPSMVRLEGESREDVARCLAFMHGNDHFFLNVAMGAAKAMSDAVGLVPFSTVVRVMARNGTDFGVRVAGLGDRWFTAPSPKVDGLYLPGFSEADAAPDIGDSVITETVGLGGCAMAAAPAIVKFVGGTPADAVRVTRQMYSICVTEHDAFQIPGLDFRGTPTGIDIMRVADAGVVPAVNTGIAHREPGVGMVGAGLVKPPMECFLQALDAFYEEYAGIGYRVSGIGYRGSGVGNRESGIGNRESGAGDRLTGPVAL